MAVGVPRVQISIIGPYQDELTVLRSPTVILCAVGAALACVSALAVDGVSSLSAGLPATALVCAVCGGGAGGLLGAFMTTAAKPDDDRSAAEGIVLVTAHVDENETGIAQAVLGGCTPTAFIAKAA